MIGASLIGVVFAAVASMVVGYVWYGPLFGKSWMTLIGLTKKDIDKAKDKMLRTTLATFVIALITAYFLGLLLVAIEANDPLTGGFTGFMVWLGFIATTRLTQYLYENKSAALYQINTGYNLVQFVVMGAVLGLF